MKIWNKKKLNILFCITGLIIAKTDCMSYASILHKDLDDYILYEFSFTLFTDNILSSV